MVDLTTITSLTATQRVCMEMGRSGRLCEGDRLFHDPHLAKEPRSAHLERTIDPDSTRGENIWHGFRISSRVKLTLDDLAAYAEHM